jgi:PAS domain-containing protein/DNA-binding CsgD family transcriptional regulator
MPNEPLNAASAQGDARFQAFVDSAFDAYYDWHIQTGLMEISAQMATLLGVEAGGLPRTFAEWLDHLHPDDREETLVRNMRAAIEGTNYSGEYRLRRGDGTYMHVRDRGIIFKDEQGRPAHMIGAFNDVSGEREAELILREQADLYETLFKNAINPAFQIASDGSFLDANEAGLAMLEIDAEGLMRQDVSSLWGPGAQAAVRACLDGSTDTSSLDLELHVADIDKALTVTLVPCRFRGERTCFALCTDVTAHQTLRRALERSEDALRRQAATLEDANAALRVILDQRNRDREELQRTVTDNMETLVLPLLERLRTHLAAPEETCLDAAIGNLHELTRPFAGAHGRDGRTDAHLTPREREVANLVRLGKTSREIAAALYISPTTVAHHRKNLRRKLGLPPRGARLASALASFGSPAPAGAAAQTATAQSNAQISGT